MVNKWFRHHSVLLVFWGLLGPSGRLAAAETRVGDISAIQQKSLLLKVEIEHARLQKELSQMSASGAAVSEICTEKGIGSLTLNAVYGVEQQRFATFSYNSSTQIDAKLGDLLLCGEKVKKISLEKVEVEKGGKRYTISGSVTAVPSAPLRTLSPNLFR